MEILAEDEAGFGHGGTVHSTKRIVVGGVTVEFPFQPYPSQIAMMDKIIKALDKSQNALLESPTGSGKSLTILCASLAWQRAYAKKLAEERQQQLLEMEQEEKETLKTLQEHLKDYEYGGAGEIAHDEQADGHADGDTDTAMSRDFVDDDDDDFQPMKRLSDNGPTPKTGVSTKKQKPPSEPEEESLKEGTGEKGKGKKLGPIHPPKIFVCSRTHKQIAQLLKELKRTGYRDVRMCVLASRDHLCTNKTVANSASKNEDCKQLLREGGCAQYNNVHKIKESRALRPGGRLATWDIEDIVGIGKQFRACPYYGSRSLMPSANIIFCPYNYIIDPVIRRQMNIDLEGHIVIIDEAHNIEDSARDHGSFELILHDAAITVQELEWAREHSKVPFECQLLSDLLTRLTARVEALTGGAWTCVEFENKSKELDGSVVCSLLEECGLTEATLANHTKALESVAGLGEDPDDPASMDTTLGARSVMLLSGLLLVAGFMFKTLICLNPAVAFSDFATGTRSIVLTSGTLSPLTSFASELGSPFPLVMEANHVIPKERVWVGALSVGPDNQAVACTYKHTSNLQWQDRIGQMVLECCHKVPYGVLCFLPSYSLLETLVARWKATGMWAAIGKVKRIVEEPRTRDRTSFEKAMDTFYAAIKKSEEGTDSSGRTGALFLAVCRGKVSEGLDFANNNARAVISIGIPYPNVRDLQVKMKREYNDKAPASRKLLPGQKWYQLQAFRALNQGLGRCIRHVNDWGAILLVDERFKSPANTNLLSKWIRGQLQHFGDYQRAMASLSEFATTMKGKDQEEASAVAPPPPKTPFPTPPPFVHRNRQQHITGFLKAPPLTGGADSTPAKPKPENYEIPKFPNDFSAGDDIDQDATVEGMGPICPTTAGGSVNPPSVPPQASKNDEISLAGSQGYLDGDDSLDVPIQWLQQSAPPPNQNQPNPPPAQMSLKRSHSAGNIATSATTPAAKNRRPNSETPETMRNLSKFAYRSAESAHVNTAAKRGIPEFGSGVVKNPVFDPLAVSKIDVQDPDDCLGLDGDWDMEGGDGLGGALGENTRENHYLGVLVDEHFDDAAFDVDMDIGMDEVIENPGNFPPTDANNGAYCMNPKDNPVILECMKTPVRNAGPVLTATGTNDPKETARQQRLQKQLQLKEKFLLSQSKNPHPAPTPPSSDTKPSSKISFGKFTGHGVLGPKVPDNTISCAACKGQISVSCGKSPDSTKILQSATHTPLANRTPFRPLNANGCSPAQSLLRGGLKYTGFLAPISAGGTFLQRHLNSKTALIIADGLDFGWVFRENTAVSSGNFPKPNCVFDSEFGLCYSPMECNGCGKHIGAKIVAVTEETPRRFNEGCAKGSGGAVRYERGQVWLCGERVVWEM